MNRGLRRLLTGLVVLVVLGGPAYFALLVQSPAPGAKFPLSLAGIRALAASLPGDKPIAVHYEDVMTWKLPEAVMVAGDSWRGFRMHAYSYQLVFPAQTIIVDAALHRSQHPADFMVEAFDEAAFDRMTQAMDRADQIVITHEHMDHIGGIAAHPRLAQLLPAVKLTAEQFANPRGMQPVKLPADAMTGYQPLRYDNLLALAPGVVLIKAPGHTPGSQMVYVQRADGRELLFLGDVCWRLRNVELVRERPLLMTTLIGEDRAAVLAQFQALHEMHEREPGVALVPGHEPAVIDTLAAAGLLQARFQ